MEKKKEAMKNSDKSENRSIINFMKQQPNNRFLYLAK